MKTIADLRKMQGISQLELAKAIGVAQNTLSNYELGNRDPDVGTLVRIADYFGVSVDDLLEHEVRPTMPLNKTDTARLLCDAFKLPGISPSGAAEHLKQHDFDISVDTLKLYQSGLCEIPLSIFLCLMDYCGFQPYLEALGLFHSNDPSLQEYSLSSEYEELLRKIRLLNRNGIKRAIMQIDDLLEIDKYVEALEPDYGVAKNSQLA